VAVLDELLDPEQPLLLVEGVAGEREGEGLLDPRVVGHPDEAGDLQAPLGLGHDVVAEVGEQVAAGHDVAGFPRHAHAVGRHGEASAHDRVLRVLPTEHRRKSR
jgi:hypothetical protein